MKQRVLFLNLPHKDQITRRYMCSYDSPESMMPPIELITMAAIARKNGDEVFLLDAIAEKADLLQTIKKIESIAPSLIVSITGFECFQEDVDLVKTLKGHFPLIKYTLFGHYATLFPSETLVHSRADYIILGEPDLKFMSLLKHLSIPSEPMDGVCFYRDGKLVNQGRNERVKDFEALPMPAYDLLPVEAYYEPLLKKPYGMIQTTRGCPYQCNYCVKSFGTKTTNLGTESIIAHIKELKKLFGIKSLRFIDDTFTINKTRVIEVSKALIDANINIEWTCLSRADNLDEEMLVWMKKSGCRRIYIGVETGSSKMLGIYSKNIDREEAISKIRLCKKVGIETAGFFMGGHPLENDDDIKETVDFAIRSQINYVSMSPLTPYPGTNMFTQHESDIDFNIYPYKNNWKSGEISLLFSKRKASFYKKFYLRPGFILNAFPGMLTHPFHTMAMGYKFFKSLVFSNYFIIGGIKNRKQEV